MAESLRSLLSRKMAVLPGTQDKNGNFLMFLWPSYDDSQQQQQDDSVHSLLLYFIRVTKYTYVNLTCKFSLIIDGRQQKNDQIKQALKIVQEYFTDNIVNVFILWKSDGFWQNRRFQSSKYAFQLSTGSTEQLWKQVDRSSVLRELGGFADFDQLAWLDYRLKTESFLARTAQFLSETSGLLAKWSSPAAPIETSPALVPLPPPIRLAVDEVDRVKHLISDHDSSSQTSLLRRFVEPLELEANSIMAEFSGQKLSFVHKTDMDRLASAVQALGVSADRAEQAWKQRANELQTLLKLGCFERDARKLLDWIEDNQQIVLIQFHELGHSSLTSQELLASHAQFSRTCLLGQQSAHSIESLREAVFAILERLSNCSNNDQQQQQQSMAMARRIQLQLNTLEHCWTKFRCVLDARDRILTASVRFHASYDEFAQRIPEFFAKNDSFPGGESVQKLEFASNQHNQTHVQIGRLYSEICYWAKILVDSLKKPDFPIDAESAQIAISYVCSLINKAFHNHRSLEKRWMERKAEIQDLMRKAIYRDDLTQVSKYLAEHGENFLAKNKSIGRSLSRAKSLLEAHGQFENVIKTTIKHARQLIDTAICGSFVSSSSSSLNNQQQQQNDRMRVFCRTNSSSTQDDFSGSDEIRLAGDLETQLNHFIERLNLRREILLRTVALFSHQKELEANLSEIGKTMDRGNPRVAECVENKRVHEVDRLIQQLSVRKEQGIAGCDRIINESRTLIRDLRADGDDDDVVEANVAHIEEITKSVQQKKMELEKLYQSARFYLEFVLNLAVFEQDVVEAKNQIEKAMLSDAADANGIAGNNRRTPTAFSAFSTSEKVCALVQNTSQRGKELLGCLESSSISLDAHLSDEERRSTSQYIRNLLRSVDEGSCVLSQFAEDQRRKLVCRAEFFRFQQNCLKVIEWMSEADNRLRSSFSLALSFAEATASKQSHEGVVAMVEEISVVMNGLARRYDAIRKYQQNGGLQTEAQTLLAQTNARWERLVANLDDRHRLINIQLGFYSQIDRVQTQLRLLVSQYANENDKTLEMVRGRRSPGLQSILSSRIAKMEQDKHSLMRSCNTVRKMAENLLRCSQKNFTTTTTQNDSKANLVLKSLLTDRLYNLHTAENQILLLWSRYRRTLDQSIQFLLFDARARQLMSWINSKEASLAESAKTGPNVGSSTLIKKHEDFCKLVRTLRDKKRSIQTFLETADNLAEVEHRYADDVKCLCSQVEIRFAQFIRDVEKEKQQIELGIGLVLPGQNEESADLAEKSWPTHKRDGRGRSKKYDFVLAELLQTERAYVRDLGQCIDHYLVPARSSDLIRQRERAIFGNIEQIHSFHRNQFLTELERYESMPENIGHCFVTTWVEKISVYVSYCTNKHLNSSLLDDRRFAEFFETCQAAANRQSSPIEPIGSFLIKPIQRITKYQLLLRDLISSSSGNEQLQEALELMLQIPRRANDAIHFNCLDGLNQDGFTRPQLGDCLIRQEAFSVWDNKQLFKKMKERRLFLFEVALVLAKEVKLANGASRYVYKSKLLMADLGISEHVDGDSLKFSVWTKNGPMGDHKLVVKAANAQIKQEWMNSLKEIVQNKCLYRGSEFLTQSPSFSPSSSTNKSNLVAPKSWRSSSTDESVEPNPIRYNQSPRKRKRRKRIAISTTGPFISSAAITTKRRVRRWVNLGAKRTSKSSKAPTKDVSDDEHPHSGKCGGDGKENPSKTLHSDSIESTTTQTMIDENDEKSLKSKLAIVNVVRELKETEKEYVRQLGSIVSTYIHSKDLAIKKPSQLQSREKHAYGNIEQIYELHRDRILVELAKCEDENVEEIAGVFRSKRFAPYIKYYENQPRANALYLEFKDYFEEFRLAAAKQTQDPVLRFDLADLLILPTQRLPRYRLLLQTIEKYVKRLSGDEGCSEKLEAINRALVEIDEVVQEAQMFLHLANLEGFPSNQSLLTLGSLLKYGQLAITRMPVNNEDRLQSLAALTTPPQTLSAFLFTQAILFSQEHPPDSKFSTPRFDYMFHVRMNQISFDRFVNWPKSIDPKISFFIETVKSLDSPQQPPPQIALCCTCSSEQERAGWYSIIHDHLKNQNDFISALTHPNSAAKQRTVSQPKSAGCRLSHVSAGQLPDRATVIADYTAVKEDEISVRTGEEVVILAANQECRFFVNRPANDYGPAAEGWVPGNVLWAVAENDDHHV